MSVLPPCDLTQETLPQTGCTPSTYPSQPGPSFAPTPGTICLTCDPNPTIPEPPVSTTPAAVTTSTVEQMTAVTGAQEAPAETTATTAASSTFLPVTGTQDTTLQSMGAGGLVLAGIVALIAARRTRSA